MFACSVWRSFGVKFIVALSDRRSTRRGQIDASEVSAREVPPKNKRVAHWPLDAERGASV